jgi:3-methylcrotonyl-CoA carboxylase alpha subunit
MKFNYESAHGTMTVTLEKQGDSWLASIGENSYCVRVVNAKDGALILHLDNNQVVTAHVVQNNGFHVWANGRTGHFSKARTAGHHSSGISESPTSPMPGTILKVHVAEGEAVKEKQILLVVEAMKMEHAIRAPRDGTVARIYFNEGDQVAQDELLVELE